MNGLGKLSFRTKLIGGVAVVALLGYGAVNTGLLAKLGLGGKPTARASQAVASSAPFRLSRK